MYEDHKPFIDTALSVRETIYNAIEQRKGGWKNAYVITATHNMREVRQLAKRLDGEIVDMHTSRDECIKNIMSDDRRKDKDKHIKLVNQWFGE